MAAHGRVDEGGKQAGGKADLAHDADIVERHSDGPNAIHMGCLEVGGNRKDVVPSHKDAHADEGRSDICSEEHIQRQNNSDRARQNVHSNADGLKEGDAELGVRGSGVVVIKDEGIGIEGDEDEEYLLGAEDEIGSYKSIDYRL